MWRRVLGLLVALLVTVSCGEDQKGATPPPPESAAPSATASPTASPTPFVSAADQEGAFAFVRTYFATLDKAYASGDIRPLRLLRKDTCRSCVQFEEQITK